MIAIDYTKNKDDIIKQYEQLSINEDPENRLIATQVPKELLGTDVKKYKGPLRNLLIDKDMRVKENAMVLFRILPEVDKTKMTEKQIDRRSKIVAAYRPY